MRRRHIAAAKLKRLQIACASSATLLLQKTGCDAHDLIILGWVVSKMTPLMFRVVFCHLLGRNREVSVSRHHGMRLGRPGSFA